MNMQATLENAVVTIAGSRWTRHALTTLSILTVIVLAGCRQHH